MIVFFDPACPKPYSLDSLRNEPLGGSEASCVRVAESLNATVVQHNRTVTDGRYTAVADGSPSAIVVMRSEKPLVWLRSLYPRAKLFLWLHDFVSPDPEVLEATGTTVVCVSDHHREYTKRGVRGASVRVIRIYNPIDDDLIGNGAEVDRNKLVFFSSPHKGLEYATVLFARIRELQPEMTLCVANPGYYPDGPTNCDGIVNLGQLPHRAVMTHVRSALCSFLPNIVFPETFGLVFAESNAVGTPVLAHDFGAAAEVAGPADFGMTPQVMDCRNPWAVANRIMEWRESRPVVQGRDEFRMSNVRKAWEKVLA